MKIINLKKRLYLIAAIVLLVGLSSAVLVYLTAGNESDGFSGYEAGSGYVYPVSPEDSKKYMHDLELYGGKANVLASELMQWFDGLWHGKSLAFTIMFISVLISSGFFLVAYRWSSD